MPNTPRLNIPLPDENAVPDIPADLSAAVTHIDGIAMAVDVGPLSSEPPSSPGSPGTEGKAFIVTDQALTGPRLDVDTGTGYFTVGPAPVDAAPNVPSSRTLGQGANQACPGNDPRLVGGAQATGDVSGAYPGPLQVNTWNGQSKAAVVAANPPQAHAGSHAVGGTDPVTGITDAQIAAANKDGGANTPSLRTLGQGAQQAAPGNDPRFVNAPPIGAIMGYAGSGDPPEVGWVIADGRLIDRTVYAAFFARSQHTYNGGVDPGGNKVRIPDKRGKSSIGAINMGTAAGAGPNDNAHHQGVRGSSYGEVYHALVNGEMPVHNHTGATTAGATGGGTTGADSPDHAHYHGRDLALSVAAGSNNYTFIGEPTAGTTATGGATARHAHSVPALSVPALGIYNDGGGAAHANIHPVEADCYIVRIA